MFLRHIQCFTSQKSARASTVTQVHPVTPSFTPSFTPRFTPRFTSRPTHARMLRGMHVRVLAVGLEWYCRGNAAWVLAARWPLPPMKTKYVLASIDAGLRFCKQQAQVFCTFPQHFGISGPDFQATRKLPLCLGTLVHERGLKEVGVWLAYGPNKPRNGGKWWFQAPKIQNGPNFALPPGFDVPVPISKWTARMVPCGRRGSTRAAAFG